MSDINIIEWARQHEKIKIKKNKEFPDIVPVYINLFIFDYDNTIKCISSEKINTETFNVRIHSLRSGYYNHECAKIYTNAHKNISIPNKAIRDSIIKGIGKHKTIILYALKQHMYSQARCKLGYRTAAKTLYRYNRDKKEK